MKHLTFITLILLVSYKPVFAQEHTDRFQEGFDAKEADDMLHLNSAFLDTTDEYTLPGYLKGYRFLYRSPDIGMDNAWGLWLREDSTVVITLRGTTRDTKSLLADFYCAMIPAQGEIVLPGDETVKYQLATDPRAAVHAGFLLGFAYLSIDMAPKIDSLYQAGYHNYLVSGHSQGGALSYYISAWLWNEVKQGTYPLLRIKTYASGAPKMSNMYFAYDYDHMTRSKWTFSIVNSADVVPEMPFTTQQLGSDMNQPNPFLDASFDNLPFFKRLFVKRAIRKMRRAAAKSSRAYQKYLADYTSNMTAQLLPGLKLPDAVNTTYFVRPGVPISLLADDPYREHFEPIADSPYYHHGMASYRFLLEKYAMDPFASH